MSTTSNEYFEIKGIRDPERVFKRLENEFIDITYPDRLSDSGLVMLLDGGLDANNEQDILWLKQLLDSVLPEIGELHYFLAPYNP